MPTVGLGDDMKDAGAGTWDHTSEPEALHRGEDACGNAAGAVEVT